MMARSALMFAGVSAICLALHNFVMIFGDHLGWAFPVSILLSYCLSALTGFILHSLLTFRSPLTISNFIRYAIAMSANIPLAFVTIWLWHDVVGLAMIWASPIATVCMVAVNFLLSRWAILPQSPSRAI